MGEARYVFQTLRNVLPEACSFCEVAFWIRFFLEKKMSRCLEYNLEMLCDSFVDVSYKMLPKKDYLMRFSQSKNGSIYIIVRKKIGSLLGV